MKKNSHLGIGPLLASSVAALTLSFPLACSQGSGVSEHPPLVAEPRPDHSAPVVEAPVPPPVTANPLKGAKLFVDPESNAKLRADSIRASDPEEAALLDKIALEPQGMWMGEWNSDIFRSVQHFVGRAVAEGSAAVIIAYNIPHRDAAASENGAGHSAGGLASKEKYQRWIRDIYEGIGKNPAVVVLEPDALPGILNLPPDLAQERLELINDAIRVLRQNPQVAVYIDVGHAAWLKPEVAAELLKKAGVEHASGFAINTSNYRATDECLEYGHAISEMVGGKHFIIDTSRNGAGPYLEAKNETETWCNPPGRKIGASPTTNTGDALCDGFLWLKRPGESDGECNGGPKAGAFWMEQALSYATP